MSSVTEKSEFRNTRGHHIGVVLKREDGKMKGMALEPHGTVLMDEEEQMATANAPRSETDNPFTNGDLELLQSARALANRRPIGDSKHEEQEVGGQVAAEAPPAAEPEAVGGGSADDEEAAPTGDADAEPGALAGADAPAVPAQPSKEEQEASARAAAARGRAPAANEKTTPPPAPPKAPEGHTGSTPTPQGKPAAEGKAAPAEEVGTPQAVPSE